MFVITKIRILHLHKSFANWNINYAKIHLCGVGVWQSYLTLPQSKRLNRKIAISYYALINSKQKCYLKLALSEYTMERKDTKGRMRLKWILDNFPTRNTLTYIPICQACIKTRFINSMVSIPIEPPGKNIKKTSFHRSEIQEIYGIWILQKT